MTTYHEAQERYDNRMPPEPKEEEDMSDFSTTTHCQRCGIRFCPDDGGPPCNCWDDEPTYEDEMRDAGREHLLAEYWEEK